MTNGEKGKRAETKDGKKTVNLNERKKGRLEER